MFINIYIYIIYKSCFYLHATENVPYRIFFLGNKDASTHKILVYIKGKKSAFMGNVKHSPG
jgi:hypothetical protein